MTFYKDEKKRIGSARWGIAIATLGFYFLALQTQMNHINFEGGGPMWYNLDYMVLGMIIVVCYLNNKLFFVKEQQKRVYIIRKYEMVPVRVKTMYAAKIRIMTETLAAMIVGSVGIYFLALAANKKATPAPNVEISIAFITVFAVAFLGSVVVFVDGYQEYKRRHY